MPAPCSPSCQTCLRATLTDIIAGSLADWRTCFPCAQAANVDDVTLFNCYLFDDAPRPISAAVFHFLINFLLISEDDILYSRLILIVRVHVKVRFFIVDIDIAIATV